MFNQDVDCQAASVPLDTSVVADVDVVADAQIKFGIVIVGTTYPPKVETAAITADMSGSIDGALRVQANVEGSFSNSVTLFDFPLPGGIVIPKYVLLLSSLPIELNLRPSFLQLGPAFRVRASAEADLGNAVDTTIGLSYRIENASLVYPAKHGHGNGTFVPNEIRAHFKILNRIEEFTDIHPALQLSMDTNVTGSVSLTGHLIPELVIGIDAFKGPAHVQAEFALSLDASATVTVNGTAGITSSTNSSAVATPPGACVDVGTALAVSAGVNTSLFGIFDADANVDLFNGSFGLYNVRSTFSTLTLVLRPLFLDVHRPGRRKQYFVGQRYRCQRRQRSIVHWSQVIVGRIPVVCSCPSRPCRRTARGSHCSAILE